MMHLCYDGSWEGLLTCIFDIYERRLTSFSVKRQGTGLASIFDQDVPVMADEGKARRVQVGLQKALTSAGFSCFYAAYLSELPGIEDSLIGFARFILSEGGSERAYAHPDVLTVSQTAKKVFREGHRMKAFVRFELTRDGFYYSEIEPDFNVIPLITTHFKERFADQKWLIYDLKRRYGIFYDLEDISEVSFDVNPEKTSSILNESEPVYQTLWRDYYTSTNIVSRKNTKLHLQHVPRRYWKYLTEKNFTTNV